MTVTLEGPADTDMRFAAEARECVVDYGSVKSKRIVSNNMCDRDDRASLDPNDPARDLVRYDVYNSTTPPRDIVGYDISTWRDITIREGQMSGHAEWNTHNDGKIFPESLTVMVAPLSENKAYVHHWMHPDTPPDGVFGGQYHWKAQLDAIPPTVSILSTQTAGIQEGTLISILIFISSEQISPIELYLNVAQDGNFVDPLYVGVDTTSVGVSGIGYHISTVNDSDDEPDGSVTVTILPRDDYIVSNMSSITIPVRDNDPGVHGALPGFILPPPEPVVRIASSSASSEGNPVRFQIDTKPRPASPLAVNVTLSHTGGLLADADTGLHNVTIPINGTLEFEIPTLEDNIPDNNTITLTINPGGGYSVGQPSTKTVSVPDDTPVPAVLVTSASSGGEEGDPVRFRIEAKPRPASPLAVNVTLSHTGDLLADADTGLRNVTIPINGILSLVVPTLEDNIPDNNTITITINPGGGYSVGQPSTETISIPDDDLDRQELHDSMQSSTVDAQLVANVRTYAAETHHGQDHVDRWNRVLEALGAESFDRLEPMTVAEAQTYADKGWDRWIPVVEALEALESEQQDEQQTNSALIANVRIYAAETHESQEHVDRWNRVLEALGAESFDGLEPMTAAEAQTYADKGWDRWIPVVKALEALESE